MTEINIALNKSVTYALDRLQAAGFEAYIVGGSVRDSLMGQEAHDFDITTAAKPEEIMSVFAEDTIICTGLQHGTVTLLYNSECIEITTYRSDGTYSDGRHPDSVEFVRSVRDDLARRDFTVNAMAYNPAEGLLDLFDGQADLRRRIIRTVGRAEERFHEDALRILRALRFAAVLDFSIDAVTAQAILEHKGLLHNLAVERVKLELERLLCGRAAARVLLEYAEVFAELMPELRPMFGFKQYNRYHIYDVWEHTVRCVEAAPPTPVLRWAALLHDCGKPGSFTVDAKGVGHFYGHAELSAEIAGRLMSRLRFSNELRNTVVLLIAKHSVDWQNSSRLIRRLLRVMGAENFFLLLDLARADNKAQAPELVYRLELYDEIQRKAEALLEAAVCFSLSDLALNGYDLMDLGYTGVEVGLKLQELLSAVVEGELANDKEVLLNYLAKSCKNNEH